VNLALSGPGSPPSYRRVVLKSRLLQLIDERGPLPFEEFMRIALYDPDGGFFAGTELRSEKAGDFLTSPEVSPLFGETLAEFVRRQHGRIGDPFRLVEVAGGSGSLLRPLLEAVAVEAWAVEISPPARVRLAEVVGPERVVAELDSVPAPLRGVVLANELIDNLPMAIAQLGPGGWRERWVGREGDGLAFVDADPRPEVLDWLERFAGPVEPGGWVEVQMQAGAWVARALSLLTEGALVLFDYGDTAENLAPRRRDGTLRTYRSHHLGPHPLDEPGATDITADVNFTALVAAAEGAGAEVSLHRQDDFLGELGLREEISQLRYRELGLARSGEDMERLRVRTRRTEGETLMHPRGLGDFRVMVATR
jgi:SAM-dependent MidA family methyltransferase